MNTDQPSAAKAPHLTWLLEQVPVACVAMLDGTHPYAVPMNFVYVPADEGDIEPARIYLHTGAGRKSAALASNPRACVTIVSGAEFNPGATPCGDTFTFRSVIVEGPVRLLAARHEREKALRAIVAKYDPGKATMPFDENVFAKTLIYAVIVETVGYREMPRPA